MKLLRGFAATLLTLTGALAYSAPAVESLPSFHGDPAQTSVSGLSSGGFMAVQYQVAYSASVMGSGIVAGGPYYCAAGNILYAGICMGQVVFMPPNAELSANNAKRFAVRGDIDPLINLEKARVYVFSGTKDRIVYQQAVDETVSFFKQAGVPDNNLVYVNNLPAGHAFISPSFGNNCAENAKPYISHCTVNGQSYDQAGALLRHIYGPLKPPAKRLTGKMVTFNQREFVKTGSSMADQAYLYVPKSCEQGAVCKVHVAFHGCKQSAAVAGDGFYANAGYNRWADTNNILVLYPQVNPSSFPFNPDGCWDWFGYTGANYAMKSGSQMTSINTMVERLLGKNEAGH